MMYTFFQNALIGVALVSVASAIVGTYVVARRMVAVTGGVTHASFAGLGLGFWAGWNPLLTALVAAVAAALGIEALTRRQVRQDTAIGVVWALGMAVGTVFIFLTPGYVPELTSFLFGNLLTITTADLWLCGAFLAVLVTVALLWHDVIISCAFDADFARTQGLPVKLVNTAMTVLVAVCVVLTSRMIGIMLLLSLITLPQLAAERITRRLQPMALMSCAISLAASLAGLLVSYFWGVPASAAIVLALVVIYAATYAKKHTNRTK